MLLSRRSRRIRSKSESSVSEVRLKMPEFGVEETWKREEQGNMLIENLRKKINDKEIKQERSDEGVFDLGDEGKVLDIVSGVIAYVKEKIGIRRESVSWTIKEEVVSGMVENHSGSECEGSESTGSDGVEEERRKEREARREKVIKKKKAKKNEQDKLKRNMIHGKLEILSDKLADVVNLDEAVSVIQSSTCPLKQENPQLTDQIEFAYDDIKEKYQCDERQGVEIFIFLFMESLACSAGVKRKAGSMNIDFHEYRLLCSEWRKKKLKTSGAVQELMNLVSMNIALLDAKNNKNPEAPALIDTLKTYILNSETINELMEELNSFMRASYGTVSPEFVLDGLEKSGEKVKVCESIKEACGSLEGLLLEKESITYLKQLIIGKCNQVLIQAQKWNGGRITLSSILPKAKILPVMTNSGRNYTSRVNELRRTSESNKYESEKLANENENSEFRMRSRSNVADYGASRAKAYDSKGKMFAELSSGESMILHTVRYGELSIEQIGKIDFIYRVTIPMSGYFNPKQKYRNIHKVMRLFMEQPITIHDAHEDDYALRDIITQDVHGKSMLVSISDISNVLRKKGPLISVVGEDPIIIIGICSVNEMLIVITSDDLRVKTLSYSEWSRVTHASTEVKIPYVSSYFEADELTQYLEHKMITNPKKNVSLLQSLSESFNQFIGNKSSNSKGQVPSHHMVSFIETLKNSKISFVPIDLNTGNPKFFSQQGGHLSSRDRNTNTVHPAHVDIIKEMKTHLDNVSNVLKYFETPMTYTCSTIRKAEFHCLCAHNEIMLSASDGNVHIFNKFIGDISQALTNVSMRNGTFLSNWHSAIFTSTHYLFRSVMEVYFQVTEPPKLVSRNSFTKSATPTSPVISSPATTPIHSRQNVEFSPAAKLASVKTEPVIQNFIRSAQSCGIPVLK